MYVRGMGQYSADTGLNTQLDTSGVTMASPTFMGPCPVAGQLMNPQTGVCTTATSPTAYVDPGTQAAASVGVPQWLWIAGAALLAFAALGKR